MYPTPTVALRPKQMREERKAFQKALQEIVGVSECEMRASLTFRWGLMMDEGRISQSRAGTALPPRVGSTAKFPFSLKGPQHRD